VEGLQPQISNQCAIKRGRDPVTALIVDDDRHVRSYLRMVLKMVGVTTAWEAGDLASAAETFRAHRPDFVLLDLELPGIDAEEATHRVLAFDFDVPVVAVTSRDDLEGAAAGQSLGVVGVVPIRALREEIARRISAALARIETREVRRERLVA
jgi:DNA-binding NarL/FixJ family response regulator